MSGIKRGDLVMVVKPQPCCGGDESSGTVAVVDELFPAGRCKGCGALNVGLSADLSNGKRILVSRLKRIDPPADMKDTETEKELTV